VEQNKLLEVSRLKKYFTLRNSFSGSRTVRAVDGVDLCIYEGETFGLVGETACGKSTLGRTILRLHEPTQGQIFYRGKDITKADMRPYRSRMQIIFQDPGGSMDPHMRVGGLIEEVLKANGIGSGRAERRSIAEEYLQKVGLKPESADLYPYEFSGGEQQRISIARALAVRPEFLVCDEPTSSLDVSIQSQIINLLEEMQQGLGLTLLFISHNLPVVRHISDRIGVMYLGKIIELGTSDEICASPLHPYTRALMAAVPVPDPASARRARPGRIKGDIWNGSGPITGCRFHLRCPHASERCKNEEPPLMERSPGHTCACWLQ